MKLFHALKMEENMKKFKRLPIKSIPNLRDLGGWPTPAGCTRWGVFLRSALPGAVSAEELKFLRDYGLTTVLDFRSEAECRRAPDGLSNVPGVDYRNISMFDAAAAGGALRIEPSADFTWGTHYIRMAEEKKQWMAQVVTALARAEGCTLYHCTTGKDRAGLITALLLSVCGVKKEDIAADYCVSQIYLRDMYREMEDAQQLCGGDIDAPFYRTEPGAIMAFLDHLRFNHGGTESYLIHCGVDKADVERIKVRLTEKI